MCYFRYFNFCIVFDFPASFSKNSNHNIFEPTAAPSWWKSILCSSNSPKLPLVILQKKLEVEMGSSEGWDLEIFDHQIRNRSRNGSRKTRKKKWWNVGRNFLTQIFSEHHKYDHIIIYIYVYKLLYTCYTLTKCLLGQSLVHGVNSNKRSSLSFADIPCQWHWRPADFEGLMTFLRLGRGV